MNFTEINQANRKKFVAILNDSGSIYPTAIYGSRFRIHEYKYYFDLDKLWANPKSFKDVTEFILDIINKEKLVFDTIGAITSRTGAFGTAPLGSVIAHNLSKPLIIFDEKAISGIEKHPQSHPNNIHVSGKSVLLIKDVVVGGKSLTNCYKTISNYQGKISGIIVLVDHDKIDDRYIGLPEETNIIRFLVGPDFPEITQD